MLHLTKLAVSLILLSTAVATGANIVTSKFHGGKKLCDLNARMVRKCSTKTQNVKSFVLCLGLCENDKSCIGASMDENGSCFKHKECPIISGCAVENTNHRYWSKHCKHGTLNPESNSCVCVDGFFGSLCDKCHKTCADLLTSNLGAGLHRVYLDPDHNGQKPVLVNCYIKPATGYNNIQLFRNEGVKDFNKTWNDYVYGFFIDPLSYWVGLYPWYRVSKAGCNELVYVFSLTTGEKRTAYRTYPNVTISDENSHYKIDTGSGSSLSSPANFPESSNFGACLELAKNIPFSTWDADRDGDAGENCASRAGSGWWYSGCSNPCNALGFGLQYLNSKPPYQVFSILDIDMTSLASERGVIYTYLKCN